MELFQQHGFNPRSDLGQNFLIDINLIELAVRAAELTVDDVVLEVAPGTGGMTTFLGEQAGRVAEVERRMADRRLEGVTALHGEKTGSLRWAWLRARSVCVHAPVCASHSRAVA